MNQHQIVKYDYLRSKSKLREDSSDRQKNGILREIKKKFLSGFIFSDSSVLGILFLCPLVWTLCTKKAVNQKIKKVWPIALIETA